MTASTARDLLGVSPTASPDDVRRAFRRRAFELHPDRNPSPSATADFRQLREAYDAVRASPADGFDADRIARDIEQAAREADRRRTSGGETARVWQQVRVALDRTPRERLADGAATRHGRYGLAVGVAVAVVAGVGVPAAAGFAAWALGLGALGLAGGLSLAARAVWTADARPWAVDTHWRGVRDLRWDAVVAWDEIREVQEGNGWLDLVLTEAAAERLRPSVPPRVLVRTDTSDEAGAVSYRLPLQTTAPLAGLVRGQLATAIAA